MNLSCYLLLAFSLSYSSSSMAQQPQKLSVTINSAFYNNKTVFLQPGFLTSKDNRGDVDLKVISNCKVEESYLIASLKDNMFSFEANHNYTHPYQLSYFDSEKQAGMGSQYFFLDSGKYTINLNDLSKENRISVNSPSNNEYIKLQKSYKKYVDIKTGEVYNINKKQKLLGKYILKHKNSFVALWDIVLNYGWVRSDTLRRIILNDIDAFSDEVKNSKTYQSLALQIGKELELEAGNQFPELEIKNIGSVQDIVRKNKYTLVDFWFTSCVPCVAQFPKLSKLYAAYHSKGFEIVGISTDSDEKQWLKTIEKQKLNWLQHLDVDRKDSRRLMIEKFPSNFLIDSTGKILRKDISMQDLEVFITEKFK